jgi:transposase
MSTGSGRKRAYPVEVRQRAVRLVGSARGVQGSVSLHAACVQVAAQLGMHADTLKGWVRQAGVDTGKIPGLSTQAAARIKQLESQVAQLEEANEILLAASTFFARELDPRPRR